MKDKDNTVPEHKWCVRPGQKYHMLTVIERPYYVGREGTNQRLQYAKFKCDCGTTKDIACVPVRDGKTKSCGCLLRKSVSERFRKGSVAKNGKKKCSKCQRIQPISEYGICHKSKDKLTSQCRSCQKSTELQREFGITLEEYNRLLEQQNGKCACCGRSTPGNRRERFAVDHCHTTGRVRGLLCFHCNTGIGHLNEDIELFRRAIDYLNSSG